MSHTKVEPFEESQSWPPLEMETMWQAASTISRRRCAGVRHGHSYQLLTWPGSLDHLLTRLSTGLAMTDAAYLEARRLRDL
jgi:hypothetical protein